MDNKFLDIRFLLFCQSYAGFRIAKFVSDSNKSTDLIKKLASVLLLDENQLKRNIFRMAYSNKSSNLYQQVEPQTAEKISIYSQIERELILLSQEKSDKSDFAEEYEYGEGLLSPAIERVAGNSLSNIKNDFEFESKLPIQVNRYRNWYYDVAYKYGLPTLRIVPFILREVVSNN